VRYFDSGFPQIILIFLPFLLSAGESACQAAKRWRFLPFARRRLGPFWQPILANRRPIVRNSRRKREKCLFARTHIHTTMALLLSLWFTIRFIRNTFWFVAHSRLLYMTHSHTTSPSLNLKWALWFRMHTRIGVSEFRIKMFNAKPNFRSLILRKFYFKNIVTVCNFIPKIKIHIAHGAICYAICIWYTFKKPPASLINCGHSSCFHLPRVFSAPAAFLFRPFHFI
jgi:hypothetical protein